MIRNITSIVTTFILSLPESTNACFVIHFAATQTIVHFSGSPLHLSLETPMDKVIQGEGSLVFHLFPTFTAFTFLFLLFPESIDLQRFAVKAMKPVLISQTTFSFTRNRLIHQRFKRKVKEENLGLYVMYVSMRKGTDSANR
ncbi:hypothetical protein [uncultured Bacteroides sp.]|uniref:hypothetical protein n=1 Tax=uncultured Bacteroides sp. TaxID=162156 RepID=UPI0025FC07A6|nr:hypothetical protein [uncultured Bacteroides sp.]